jgi:stearoyl-CoA desaturase (delta-9 desaturase)
MSNYGNHTWGYRNFETKEESKNTWWLAILTFGEGWHNNHHAKPGRWNFSHKWWEIDMSAWVIRLLKTS